MDAVKTMLRPCWPKGVPFVRTDRCKLTPHPFAGLKGPSLVDAHYEAEARRLAAREAAVQNTGLNGTYLEAFFVNEADHTAYANSTSEGSLISGLNKQPVIPATYFLGPAAAFRGFTILARGVLSTTSTPTIIFQVRAGTTSGPTFLSGASLGVSAAISTASGVSNKWWELRLDLICTTRGIGTGNATFSGAGYVRSPGGFSTSTADTYPLEPTTPDTATWTSVFDASVTQYLNLSATWSAASASNTITCKQLICWAFG